MSKNIFNNLHTTSTENLYNYVKTYFETFFKYGNMESVYTKNLTHVLLELVLRDNYIDSKMLPYVLHYNENLKGGNFNAYMHFDEDYKFHVFFQKNFFAVNPNDSQYDKCLTVVQALSTVCHEFRHIVQEVYADTFAKYTTSKEGKSTHDLFSDKDSFANYTIKLDNNHHLHFIIPENQLNQKGQQFFKLSDDFSSLYYEFQYEILDLLQKPNKTIIEKQLLKRLFQYDDSLKLLHPMERDADTYSYEFIHKVLTTINQPQYINTIENPDNYSTGINLCLKAIKMDKKVRQAEYALERKLVRSNPIIDVPDLKEEIKNCY